MTAIHIVGAGGHGRVVYDVVQAVYPGRAVVWHDDAWETLSTIPPVTRIEPVERLMNSSTPMDCFVAIGRASARMETLEALSARGHTVVAVVHPSAVVSPFARIETGAVVMAGAVVQTAVILERGGIVNTSASVDHDCHLGRGAHVAPGAHLAGTVTVGEQTWIGAGAVVREGTTIGARVMVGAGAVILRDIPDDVTVVGNPGRIVE